MRAEVKLPEILKGDCEVHGVEEFKYIPQADLWACLGPAKHLHPDKEPKGNRYCSSLILGEDFTPDGYDVVVATDLNWGNVSFNRSPRYSIAWTEYLRFCGLF